MREGTYDPLDDAVLAAMVASEYVPQTDAERAEVMRLACADAGASDEYQRRFIPGDVPDDEPTSPRLMPLDDIEGNGRGPT